MRRRENRLFFGYIVALQLHVWNGRPIEDGVHVRDSMIVTQRTYWVLLPPGVNKRCSVLQD